MQLVAGIAGAVVGFAIGGPAGAQIGFTLGTTAYGLFGPKPQGPGPGDLKRPQLTLGAQIARVYGRTRRPLQLVWASDYRATEVEQGGKGMPEGPSSYTYSLDVYGWLADGSNVLGFSRLWINNELVYTALDASDIDSIDASESTSRWDGFEFLGGGASQVSWAVYEDAVGATDAPGYRGVASLGIENLQVGGSQNVPFIEVEPLTAADTEPPANPPLERLFEFNYSEIGSGQFGNADFSSPARIIGEVSPTSNSITFYLYTSPTAAPIGGTVTVSGVGGGGITPYGGTGDSEAVIFRAGGTLYGYYGNLVDYTHSTADLTLVNTLCYAFEGDALYVCTDQGELYRWTRSTGGTELATNASAEVCRTIVMLDGSVYGADPFTTGDLVEWDGSTLAETGRWSLAANSLGLLCTDGSSVFDFVDNGGTVAMVQFNGATWDTVVTDMGDMDAYLLASGNQSNPVLLNGYVYLSRSDGAFDWLLMRSRYRLTVYSPLTVDLQDIVDAELARVPGLDPSDWDSSDLAGLEVTGYTAVGSAAQALADLGDVYHFDLVPGSPMRFVRRSAATVGSIAFADTGAGVNEAGEPFTGLKLGNNDESPAVVGLTYPNVEQDHDVDFQSGDRLTTDGPDVRRVQTNVVLTPAEARGRAFSATVLQRSAAKTASFGISDAYAAAEPGDAYAVTDIDGNTYNLRIKRFTYADGVKQCEWELNDISALVDELDTETDYTEAVTVRPGGTADWLPLDIPLLRTADDGAGYYAAVQTSGDELGYWYESADDTSYSQRTTFPADVVFGTVTAISGTVRADGFFDETATVTVDVGQGTLASATRADLLGARTVNACAIGVNGRWVLGQFRGATLSAPGIYVLSGLLMGQKGTERHAASLQTGDHFVLLTERLRRISRDFNQLGVEFYVKAVAERRPITSVDGERFTNEGESVTPLSPVQLRTDRDAVLGDITLTWKRRTRYDTRFVGPLGASCPLGEASEAYEVDILDGSTVVRTLSVTEPEALYTLAQQLADFGSVPSTFDVAVYQVSETIGRGAPLEVEVYSPYTAAVQSNTITLGGTFTTGVPIRVRVNGLQIASYTTVIGDTDLDGVAASLAAVLDALSGYAASAAGSVVTITGPAGASYTLSVEVGGASTISAGLSQSASPVTAGTSYRATLWIGNLSTGISEPVPAGVTFTVQVLNGPVTPIGSFSYTTTASSTKATIFAGLAAAFNATGLPASGYSFSVQSGSTVGYYGLFIGPLGVTSLNVVGSVDTSPWDLGRSIQDVGTAPVLTARAQVITLFLDGTVADDEVFEVTLGGVTYSYTATVPTDVVEDVVDGLVADIDPAADYAAVKTDTYLFDVTGPVNTPFSYSAQIVRAITATVA